MNGRFAQARGAAAHGARVNERPRHFRTLVRLAVRPKRLAARFQVRGHLPDVVFDRVVVEQEGRG